MGLFGHWLTERYKTNLPQEVPAAENIVTTEVMEKLKIVETNFDHMPLEPQIGRLIGVLTRYFRFSCRQKMPKIGLSGLDEFGCLANIWQLGNPNKTELAEAEVLELTTVVEIVKRLERLQLVVEEIDANDRRSKRLTLTTEGANVLFKSIEILHQISNESFSELTMTEKVALQTILKKLQQKHALQYAQRVS